MQNGVTYHGVLTNVLGVATEKSWRREKGIDRHPDHADRRASTYHVRASYVRQYGLVAQKYLVNIWRTGALETLAAYVAVLASGTSLLRKYTRVPTLVFYISYVIPSKMHTGLLSFETFVGSSNLA